ncbi:hypothetical protein RQP46_010240 [Phenoliferia psychrophenolica]
MTTTPTKMTDVSAPAAAVPTPTPSGPSEGEVIYWQQRPGIAPIKQEYVLWDKMRTGPYVPILDQDDEAEGRTTTPDARGPSTRTLDDVAAEEAASGEGGEGGGEPAVKKVRLSGAEKKRAAKARSEAAWQAKKADKAAQKAERDAAAAAGGGGEEAGEGGGRAKGSGQNKNRKFDNKAGVNVRLCVSTAKGNPCPRESTGCRSSHDLALYLSTRSPDIPISVPSNPDDLSLESLSITPRPCPLFAQLGQCPYGFKCQFGASHMRDVGESKGFLGTRWELVVDEEKVRKFEEGKGEGKKVLGEKGEMNVISMDQIKAVRGQGLNPAERFPLSKIYMDSINEPLDTREGDNAAGGSRGNGGQGKKGGKGGGGGRNEEKAVAAAAVEEPTPVDAQMAEATMDLDSVVPSPTTTLPSTSTSDAPSTSLPTPTPAPAADTTSSTSGMPDLAPIRASEKKRLDFAGKLYLAPLTTVGNLPFRRLAVQLGADITCSEMGLAQEFLNGNNNEWSLLRRHPSEKLFGVQICGSKPQVLVPAAEIIAKSCEIDFLDVNCGCPIDLVFNKGAGSALLQHATKLGKALAGMSQVLGEVPLTIKIRNGITHGQPVAHKLVTRFQGEWGVSAMTLHGRSRQQRYKNAADYAYIGQVAQTLRDTASDLGLPSIPIFGNGDAYDYRTYYENMEASGVDGIMIARGALVKPWIFTEIKERRDWDISSRERLDQIGQLATYGLEHWGSDTQGINITRRFLLESLSFQHRYVPVGLLERFPTLLASDQSEDWIKISNMFLGPPPDDWVFLPKHKANAVAEEVQG